MLLIKHKKKKALTAWLLSFALLFTAASTLFDTPAEAVSQSQINALKQQQSTLAQKKAGIQSQANAINNKVASQTEKLNLLTQQLNITNSELQNLTAQIAYYTNSIAQMENDLNLDEQKEQELLARYKVRMRAMEENGTSSYISIVLGASSFEDLLGRIDCVREIMEYDNKLITDVRDAKAKTQKQKTDTEAEVASQKEVFTEYQAKQADLASQQQEAQAVLASLKSDSADYAQQLAAVKALQSSIGGQISSMQAELAEQQRLAAEQAAADKVSSSKSGKGDNWSGGSTQAGSGTGQEIVSYAERFLGVPYVYGGTSPSGFDCSGLVYYCYTHYGYSVNRTAASLAYNGVSVSKSSLRPGDIILFTSEDGGYVGHTGIYIGGGQFIHAPHTGDVVKVSSLSDSYYTSHYWGARRVIG